MVKSRVRPNMTRSRAPAPASQQPRPVKREEISVLQRIRQEAMLDSVVPAERQAKTETQSAPNPMDNMAQEMMREIRSLRGMLEGQLAGLAWGELQRSDPVKVEILRHMLTAGFSPALSRQLLEKLPPGGDFNRGMKWVKAALIHNLRAVAAGKDIIERGGVYALVGPTGVGKTTTVAKLAARCVCSTAPTSWRCSPPTATGSARTSNCASTAASSACRCMRCKDEADLQFTLADLQNKHLVLIDTVGMSQRDRRLAEQVALLTRCRAR